MMTGIEKQNAEAAWELFKDCKMFRTLYTLFVSAVLALVLYQTVCAIVQAGLNR